MKIDTSIVKGEFEICQINFDYSVIGVFDEKKRVIQATMLK